MSRRSNRGAPPPPDTNTAEARAAWGDQLAEWRSAQGITQPQAAEKLGTTLRTYCRWEGGEVLPKGPARRRGWGAGDDASVAEMLRGIDERLQRIELRLGLMMVARGASPEEAAGSR